MGDGWDNALTATSWAAVVAAFVFGLACGWLLAGGWRGEAEDAPGERREPPAGADDARLCAAEMELKAVRSFLDENADAPGEIDEQMSSLDETIKRANGRLKLLIAAVKKASFHD